MPATMPKPKPKSQPKPGGGKPGGGKGNGGKGGSKPRPKKEACGKALLAFDADIWQKIQADWPDAQWLIGVDEVGRGSMIGPVVSAAVCFHHPIPAHLQEALLELNDSKQLTPQTRQRLVHTIKEAGVVFVAQANLEEIDTLNIHHASLLALHRAAVGCQEQLTQPENSFLLLDGRWPLPHWERSQQRPIIKGDTQSACIAAASVIAKEWRDELMRTYAEACPEYGWHSNMGYATPDHRATLQRIGPSPYHRKSFKLKASDETASL